ncbi:DUF6379 domain-containing protein [Paenibacillus sp. NFR01]|uniref:C-glycoside deglycosidase beta subunit domain-containing protein n=1 Tax=Paenibacillus sp. NFR01 TaxID=1566279 RepID=UPI0008D79D31|nr:DUF6379 domain-containing protein [Paenibacillus sp. NFR01]SET22518.1 hypothetical protein SAMN03159358_1063 [Paenibacillus sp. NFR01]
MFDNYVLSDNSLRNVKKDGVTTGFEMRTRITYYRGIPLSMVHDIQVEVNGVPVPREHIRFSLDGEQYFTLDEMTTVTFYKWEYGQEGLVYVEQEGGLPEGEHKVKLTQVTRVAYIPVPFSGTQTKTMTVAV